MYNLVKMVVFIMCLYFPLTTNARDSSIFISKQNTDILVFNSEINDDSYDKVLRLYREYGFSTIILTSNGGEYDSGMKLAQFVHKNKIKIYVPQYCASACTFMFMAAYPSNRDISVNASIGLHNISFMIQGDASTVKLSVYDAIEIANSASKRSANMIALYAANGIPATVLVKVANISGSDIINVSREELLGWGTIILK